MANFTIEEIRAARLAKQMELYKARVNREDELLGGEEVLFEEEDDEETYVISIDEHDRIIAEKIDEGELDDK